MNPNPPLLLLIALAGIGPLALNIFIPSMPGLQTTFATDYGTVQLTLSFYLAATAVAQLFLGTWSDRLGRRPVVLAGLLLFVIGSFLATLASSIALLIGARILQAVGGAVGMVVGRAIVRDINDEQNAASQIAYIAMAMVIAPMIAPALGGYLDVWFDWRASFITVAVAGLLVWLWALAALPETLQERRSSTGVGAILRDYVRLLKSPLFCAWSVTMAFSSGVFFTFLAGAPYVMVHILHRTPDEYGLYFVLVSLGYMSGNFFAGRMSRRLGTHKMIALGCLLAVFGTLLNSALSWAGILGPLSLFGCMAIVALSNGICLPNATAAAVSVIPSLTGTASGLAGFLQIAVGALGTVLVGALLQDSHIPLIIIMQISAIIALLALLVGVSYSRSHFGEL